MSLGGIADVNLSRTTQQAVEKKAADGRAVDTEKSDLLFAGRVPVPFDDFGRDVEGILLTHDDGGDLHWFGDCRSDERDSARVGSTDVQDLGLLSELDQAKRKNIHFLMRKTVHEKFLSVAVETESDVVGARSNTGDVEHLLGRLASGP